MLCLTNAASLKSTDKNTNTMYDSLIDVVKLMGFCYQVHTEFFKTKTETEFATKLATPEVLQALEAIETTASNLYLAFVEFENRERTAKNQVLADNYKAIYSALTTIQHEIIAPLLNRNAVKHPAGSTEEAKRIKGLFSNLTKYKKAFRTFIPHFDIVKAMVGSDGWKKGSKAKDFAEFTKGFANGLELSQFFFNFISPQDKPIAVAFEKAEKLYNLNEGGRALWNLSSSVFFHQFKIVTTERAKYLPENTWDSAPLDERLQVLQGFIGLLMPDSEGYSPVESYLYGHIEKSLNNFAENLRDDSLTLEADLEKALSKQFSATQVAAEILSATIPQLNTFFEKASEKLKAAKVKNAQDYINTIKLSFSTMTSDFIPFFVKALVKDLTEDAAKLEASDKLSKEQIKIRLKAALTNENVRKDVRDKFVSNFAGFILKPNEFSQFSDDFANTQRALAIPASEFRDLFKEKGSKFPLNLKGQKAANSAVPVKIEVVNLNDAQKTTLAEAQATFEALTKREQEIINIISSKKTVTEIDEVLSTEQVPNLLKDIEASEKKYYEQSGVVQAGALFKKASFKDAKPDVWLLSQQVNSNIKAAVMATYTNLHETFFEYFSIEQVEQAKLESFYKKLSDTACKKPKSSYVQELSELLTSALREKTFVKMHADLPITDLKDILTNWNQNIGKLKNLVSSDKVFAEVFNIYKDEAKELYNLKTGKYESIKDHAHKQIMTEYLLKLLGENENNFSVAYNIIAQREDRSPGGLLNTFGDFLNSQIKSSGGLQGWHGAYLATIAPKPEPQEEPKVEPIVVPKEEPVVPKVEPVVPKVEPIVVPQVEAPLERVQSEDEKKLRKAVTDYIANREKSYIYSDRFFGKMKRMTKKRKIDAANDLIAAIDFHYSVKGSKLPPFDVAALSEGKLGKLVKQYKDRAEFLPLLVAFGAEAVGRGKKFS